MINDLTKHQINIQRLAGGIFRDLTPQLKKLRDDISLRILSTPTIYQTERLAILLKDIDALINDTTKNITPSLFEEFAVYENEFNLNLLDKSTVSSVVLGAGIQPTQLMGLISKEKIQMGGKKPITIDQAVKVFSKRYAKDIKTEIELGILEGQTTQQIVRRVEKLANNRTRNQAEALVRTITNHVGSVARNQVWEDNKELFQGEEYVAVLDSRTSPICQSLDGNIYPIGKGPRPPLHYNCRSIRVPKIKPEYDLDIDKTRASSTGPVSSKLTYSGWLRSQSKEVQNEVLGTSFD